MRKLFLTGLTLTGGILLLKRLRRRAPIALQDKVVIVTGASEGIGRATALAFAAAGANVVAAARNAQRLQELEVRYPSIKSIPADLTDDATLENLITTTMQTYGRIDILVNNAGYARGGPLEELAPEALHRILHTNLHGMFRLTQLVLPIMYQQHSGHIINISSGAANINFPGLSVYSATKAAIVTFSNCTRREVLNSGITVSTVLPGAVRTASRLSSRWTRSRTRRTPSSRRQRR